MKKFSHEIVFISNKDRDWKNEIMRKQKKSNIKFWHEKGIAFDPKLI